MKKQQHFMLNSAEKVYQNILESISLDGLSILEIGAGHGELTKLILNHPIKEIHSFEIEIGLCPIKNKKLKLIEQDVKQNAYPYNGWSLISNPPYVLLDWIINFIFPIVKNILILIPEHRIKYFTSIGFEVVGVLEGRMFMPSSSGRHFIVKRGFDGCI